MWSQNPNLRKISKQKTGSRASLQSGVKHMFLNSFPLYTSRHCTEVSFVSILVRGWFLSPALLGDSSHSVLFLLSLVGSRLQYPCVHAWSNSVWTKGRSWTSREIIPGLYFVNFKVWPAWKVVRVWSDLCQLYGRKTVESRLSHRSRIYVKQHTPISQGLWILHQVLFIRALRLWYLNSHLRNTQGLELEWRSKYM